jgi:predicted nucleic acid-binding protein
MTLVDSSVLIDYFNGIKNLHTEEFDKMLGNEIVVIGDYILAEVLQGFRSDSDFSIAKEYLQSFPCYDLCNETIAVKNAENFRLLRKKGKTVRKTVDLIIGTFCIENEIELLHNDKDFNPMEKMLGLKVRKVS